MSQITRCPSCTTKFKVVADQLRISDGWVRCGQCKEVFDASAHLLPSEPQALLPDVSMTATRPPSMPVTRSEDASRGWGDPSAPVKPAAVSALIMPSVGSHDSSWGPAAPDAVLDVPVPAVPAFLVSGTAAASSPEAAQTLQSVSPFAWRSVVSADGTDMVPIAGALTAASLIAGEESPKEETPSAQMDGSAAGYELPSAELSDTDWSDELPHENLTQEDGTLHRPFELQRKQSVEEPVASGFGDELESSQEQEQEQDGGRERVSNTSFDEPEALSGNSASGIGLEEELAGASLGDILRVQEEDDQPEKSLGADEVSFVRAAKRKAFWRRPLVRVGLVAVLVVLLCALALQAVLHERDRIAAVDSRLRPWLQILCEPFQCALAPLRQISDVMIDSSSFNKGRGDSYQLTFVIKNRATVPLAMPAMELTLTDAQDQPVLRRVFFPQDMAAPAELPALGEWTTSVAVVVTTGGARVAGYRLLAFYP